jgi:AcrR family transcriptional regulator
MSYIEERRQEEKERRRAEIVDAAEQIFGEIGFANATMDEIARRARLSRALVYVYFRDKDELRFAICERAMLKLAERFGEAVARNKLGLEQIEAVGRAYLAFSHEFPVYFEACSHFEAHSAQLSALGTNEAACLEAASKVHAIAAQSIETGVRDGSIRKDIGNPAIVSHTLWGFLHGVIQVSSAKANVLAYQGISAQDLLGQAILLARRSLAAAGP